MQLKKLILAGGTGFLGQAIINRFGNSETQLIVLTRGNSKQNKNVRYLNWDGKIIGDWAKEIDGADIVINLTGKSVDCRYNEKNKAEIISSRINATKVLGEAIRESKNPPRAWLNCASATIYRNAEDRAMDEFDGEFGTGFSVEVCKQWEQSFNEAETPMTRKVTLRISMVLGNDGGVIPVLTKLVKAGLGGKMGTGNQYISWIHVEDFLDAITWLIENEKAVGAFNIAAPEPIPNKEFMKQMRNLLHKKIGLPTAKWMLEIGAVFLRTETELILKSRRVIPKKLLNDGFKFKFSSAEQALKNLLN